MPLNPTSDAHFSEKFEFPLHLFSERFVRRRAADRAMQSRQASTAAAILSEAEMNSKVPRKLLSTLFSRCQYTHQLADFGCVKAF